MFITKKKLEKNYVPRAQYDAVMEELINYIGQENEAEAGVDERYTVKASKAKRKKENNVTDN